MGQLLAEYTKDGARVTRGSDTLRENCTAAKLITELFSTSIGPDGMAKILLKDNGEFEITRDAEIISKQVKPVHPVAKILMEAGQAVRSEVGDGFISTVLLAGLLIEKAWKLVHIGLHPSLIATGYKQALDHSLKTIESSSMLLDSSDHEVLVKLAERCLNTKIPLSWARHLAPITVEALLSTTSNDSGRIRVRRELVKIEGRSGGSVEDSLLVKGVLLHKKGMDRLMPKIISDARIAFVQSMMSIKRPDMFTKVMLSNPTQVSEFYEWRWSILEEFLQPVFYSGANVLLCGGDIAEELRKPLANRGILAVRNVAPEDMKILREATGGELVLTPRELHAGALGYCSKVVQRVVAAHDEWLFFEGCRNSRLSIFIRGPGDFIVDEIKRAVATAIKMLETILSDRRLVPGNGVIEYIIAREVRKLALNAPSKTQLVLLAFAEALEDLPLFVVANSGGDTLTAKSSMRSKMIEENGSALTKYSKLVYGSFVPESSLVKIQILKSAVEAAATILRIDHMIIQPPKPIEKKDPIPAPVKAVRKGKI
jgi:chaperonin GroEL (HSP60 family)